jgi:hypothetical protein
MTSVFKIALKYTLISASALLVWLTAEMLLGFHDKYVEYYQQTTLLSLIIPIITFRFSFKEYNKAQAPNNANFIQSLGLGLIMTAFSAVFSTISLIIFLQVISPDFFNKMLAASDMMAKRNGFDVIATHEQAIIYFSFNSYIKQTIIGTVVFGCILSLVYSFINYRNNVIKPKLKIMMDKK